MPTDVSLVIQVHDGSPQIWKDIDQNQAFKLIEQHAPTIGGRLKELENRLTNVAKEIIQDPDKTVEYFLLSDAQARTDELLNCDLDSLPRQNQFARIDEYHRYTAIGSAQLYADAGFSGSSKFFSVTWPNFKWKPYRFNDKASSAKAWGVNTLFENTWYRGRTLWLIGLPYVEIPDFKELNFDNIASSFVSAP